MARQCAGQASPCKYPPHPRRFRNRRAPTGQVQDTCADCVGLPEEFT